MKWLIYLLLLANLAFGLWHYYRSENLISATPPSHEDDNLRLVLLKEFQDQQKKPTTVQANTETSGSCYSLGPFKTVNDANSVRDRLKTGGVTAKRRMSKDTSRKGFWVYLAPEQTRSQAHANINRLKQKGIEDYFLVVTGDMNNAVSLGVFAQSDTAKHRIEEIKALGFNPKIQNVDLPRREYWLDWPVEQSVATELLGKINKKYDGIGQTTRPCNGS